MVKSSIDKIKQIETQAEEIKTKANFTAEKILAEAISKSEKSKKESLLSFKAEKDKIINNAQNERDEILIENEKKTKIKVDLLKSESLKKQKNIINTIIEEII